MLLRRLRRRLARRLLAGELDIAFWSGWEEGACEAVARLAARVEGRV